MKNIILITFCFSTIITLAQSPIFLIIDEVANMPEPISNNAVVEGFVNDTAYVFSFSGIGAGKTFADISLKSFRYNTVSDIWDTIPNLPDTLGKIAAGASYVDSIIYIIGGYHVFQNGNEISSNKVHRYDPRTNAYLSDGANIPVAIDDHVQAVYKDSLIYVITGWSNTNNVANVQIYDPVNDNWLVGTSVPNNNTYRAFGASGTIIGNTIYYHGGASSGFNFPGQSTLRIGTIDPNNPTQITWTSQSTSEFSYRSACTVAYGAPIWIGGSETTYNFDGIAYNGSGGVSPRTINMRYLGAIDTFPTLDNNSITNLNVMDLRGVANMDVDPLSGTPTGYVAGGMSLGQQVSDKTYRFQTVIGFSIKEKDNTLPFKLYPNPSVNLINLDFESTTTKQITVINMLGEEMFNTKTSKKLKTINITGFPKGNYMVEIESEEGISTKKLIVQ